MPSSPAASAALATVVLDAAPVIASALARLGRTRVRFEYGTAGVTVSGPALERAFGVLWEAFSAAGWGCSTRYDDLITDLLVAVTFQPPHTLTQCGQPPAFPPR